ncbi:MAG: superoxide dismutase family protein [Alphaproteobacteria bacterium]|nr:superoxide dismutase family protein [Alphaproteobacteria bacterium]
MHALTTGAAVLATAVLVSSGHVNAQEADTPYAASTSLIDQNGKEVGTVVLRQTKAGPVWLHASLFGLPAGVLAFHIHEKGDCGDGFKAAGGHFAPKSHDHGVLSENGPHAGDLPNIYVPESGKVKFEHFSDRVTLATDSESSLFDNDGSALVIHSGVDDYKSQPSGAAGDRIACGVIENRITTTQK